MIDLHCHSYYSDGTLSPELLIQRAISAQVQYLALTDHDTTVGLAPLHAAALEHDVKIINGLELSVLWKKHTIHIIGLMIDPHNETLNNLLILQNDSRIERAKLIGSLLSKVGIKDAYLKACDIAGHERVGRAHFAKILMDEGKADTMQVAFKRYLGVGKLAYVATSWVTLGLAVEAIVCAGGQAVIAHPLKYKLTRSKLHELIGVFKGSGGVGMEVVSGDIDDAKINELAILCKKFDLLASTGSDFHDDKMSRVKIGCQKKLPLICKPIWFDWPERPVV